ncbi:probable cytochrome P450 313a4 [Musca autumnalis]|uniref:probable cytochrome P450 313a4 n=1 Tax=Musca autumnalis TaxID=221902 RepID=UPI003CF8D91E
MLYWPIFGIICVWLYWLWSRRRYYYLMFKLPGPIGYPLIGEALNLIGKIDPLYVINSYNEKFGPIMYSWLLHYPFLLITDLDAVRDVLTSPHCIKRSVLYKPFKKGIGEGLFTLEDPEWSVHRKNLNPAFSHKILLSFLPIFNQEINKLVKTFDKMDECPNVITTLQNFTMKITLRTTMGIEESKGRDSTLHKNYQCLIKNGAQMAFSPWLANDMVRRLFGIFEPFNSCVTENQEIIREVIRNKLSRDSHNGSENVFIDQAIEVLEKHIFTMQNVEDELNHIVLGAFETTANAIGYVLILLAMFPEYQERVYEELLSIFPAGEDFEVTNANIQDMTYMDMVINESMRILTPIPAVGRQNTQDLRLSNGIVIPPGVQLNINIFAIHRRKDIWGPDADIFNPDNFLPSNMENKHPYAFIPFTKGLRTCIGYKYGLMSVKVALAKLLMNFKFSTEFKYSDLEFCNSIVLSLKHMPVLKITKRHA